jgi:hypothetical protein
MNGSRSPIGVLALLLLGGIAPAAWAREMVCVAPGADQALSRWRAAKQVAVAKVESEASDAGRDGSTYRLAVVRSYKGGARVLWASRKYCEDCGSLQVGEYVLAFATGERFGFMDSCDAPQSVRGLETQKAITLLDKQLHFPPLSLPQDAVKARN